MLYRKLIEEHLEDPRIVLYDADGGMTFGQIHHAVSKYCLLFQRQGILRGDRILVTAAPSLKTVILILACIASGVIFVPVSEDVDEMDRKYIVKDCTPKALQDNADEYEMDDGRMAQRELCTEHTLAYIIYTSGSEGIPKGVVASQKQILFCSKTINERLCNTKKDKILCCLPMSFDYGLYQIFLSFFSGAVLILERGNIIQRIPYLLNKWKITAFPTIPTVANLMVKAGMLNKAQTASLRYITFTGEVLSVALLEELAALLPETRLVPMYGLTECKRVSVMPLDRADKIKAGSCGLPLEGVRVYLKQKDAVTGIGELAVAGDNVMEGYWNARAGSDPVFSVDEKTGERVVCTGDLFRIDEDGFLYFCGRKSDIIKIKGYRVSGMGIESKLKKIKEIREIAVIGVPDSVTGENLAIFVYTCQDEIVREEINLQMRKGLPCLQNYELYMFKEPLPRNKNGKIDRNKLKRTSRGNEIFGCSKGK